MCRVIEALEIEAKSDLLLVITQISRDYECKEEFMSNNMRPIKDEIDPLKRFVFEQVPRLENHQVDALSKLASSTDFDIQRTMFWEVKPKKIIVQEEVMFLS